MGMTRTAPGFVGFHPRVHFHDDIVVRMNYLNRKITLAGRDVFTERTLVPFRLVGPSHIRSINITMADRIEKLWKQARVDRSLNEGRKSQ